MYESVASLGEVQNGGARRFDFATREIGATGSITVAPNWLRGGNVVTVEARINNDRETIHRSHTFRGGDVLWLYDYEWVIGAIESVVLDGRL